MDLINVFGREFSIWVLAPSFYALWVFVGWIVKKAVFVWLDRLSRKTSTHIDDVVVAALNFPLIIFIVVSGFAVLVEIFFPHSPTSKLARHVSTALKVGTILAIVLFVDRLVLGIIKHYSAKIEVLRISQGFSEVVAQVVVITLGGLVLLDSLGISITPIIASLGIGSLAVALALQPTLENIISGFQIIVDRPIVAGHFVKLESGEEGYVEKVGWRSTWIRQLANNMVIIPNKVLLNSRVINFYYPSKDLAVLVEAGVHYDSDLEKVERVMIEVATETMQRVPGADKTFKPFVRYHTFGASSINFTVIMKANEFVDNYLLKHEFVKALSARYKKERIVLPFPIVALNTEQEKAFPKPS